MEKTLLHAALTSRTSFALIQEHVKPEAKNRKDVRYSPEFRILMDKIASYYDNDADAKSVDRGLMEELIDASVPNNKHKERFKTILNEALASDVSVPNINALILMAKRHEVGDKLAQTLINRDDPAELLEQYNKLMSDEAAPDEEESSISGNNIMSIITKRQDIEGGVKLRPKSLQDAIGGRGLAPGSKVTIFGRPEISKSAFCITNTAGWLIDGKRVLYLINEDPAENIIFRILCCITGLTEDEVYANPERANEIALRRGFANLVVHDLHPGSLPEIAALVDKHKPDVILVDQLRNLRSKEDSRVNQLDEVARGLRDIGKAKKIVVVDVTQAGESAEGKSVLTMTDIDSSKTGVPAAADLLIGIGANKEQEASGYRCLSLCKNKVNGFHGVVTVKVNPFISRYTDV